MVRDEHTDGRRIAEHLASELTGLTDGPLAAVTVVDADTDVSPTPDGARAYDVAVDEESVATVRVHPAAAVLAFDDPIPAAVTVPERHLSVDGPGCHAVVVERAAGVKAAVDVLRAVLDA